MLFYTNLLGYLCSTFLLNCLKRFEYCYELREYLNKVKIFEAIPMATSGNLIISCCETLPRGIQNRRYDQL